MFLKLAGLAGLSLPGAGNTATGQRPLVLSTWRANTKANAAAWQVLQQGGSALDAAVAGCMVPEADPADTSVGYGGLPDRDGRVTLDACVMDHKGNCGAVFCLEHIKHPVQVARLVMEQTPHVQLSGEGALAFALSKGFQKENLLTPAAEKAWKEWLQQSHYTPGSTLQQLEKQQRPQGLPNHDTIGMLVLDANGNISGACSTSGMAYKMRGRIGDSPIIGAGLYVDNEVGAATASGVGEEIVRICGAHTVVEAMRHGASPEEACREAVKRMVKRLGTPPKDMQAGFIAIDKKGNFGGFSFRKNFSMAVHTAAGPMAMDTKYWFA